VRPAGVAVKVVEGYTVGEVSGGEATETVNLRAKQSVRSSGNAEAISEKMYVELACGRRKEASVNFEGRRKKRRKRTSEQSSLSMPKELW
jgi:hypothetical protein